MVSLLEFQFAGTTFNPALTIDTLAKPELFLFGCFVLARLAVSSPYGRKKRVAARRGVHIA